MALKTVKEVLDAIVANKGKRCFLYFIASPDESGESWCPDCRHGKLCIQLLLCCVLRAFDL